MKWKLRTSFPQDNQVNQLMKAIDKVLDQAIAKPRKNPQGGSTNLWRYSLSR